MSKPPSSPPSSDIGGVHQDGMRPSKPLPSPGSDNEDMEQAAEESVGRPDYSTKESSDDRTS